MRTLTAHLRQPGDHGRLRFHPACPICRQQRLAGALPPDDIVPRRTHAILAACVLTLSSAEPCTALAAGQGEEQQGVAMPAAGGSADSAQNPDFDPGGDSSQLPEAPPPGPQMPAPPAAGNDDTAPLDQEPKTDTDAPIVDAGDAPTAATPGAASTPASPPSSPPAAPSQPAATPADAAPAETPVPAATLAPTATPTPPPATATASPLRRARHRPDTHRAARKRPFHPLATPTTPPPASSSSTPGVVRTPASATTSVAASSTRAAQPGHRAHVVRPGESLWSIAADVLGDAASPASIARTVHGLWELNHARIGTGDPDLLMPGTRLVLP